MKNRLGVTTEEVLAALIVAFFALLIAAGVVVPMLLRARESGPHRPRCRRSLMSLAKGMATYLNECGDNRWYPCPLGMGLEANDYDGAEWLAALYWTRVLPDPDMFLCPNSTDSNYGGCHLGSHGAVAGSFGSSTVSYAAMHYYSLTDTHGKPKTGAIPMSFPPDPTVTPMASDDTEGTINHGEARSRGMNILFFDAHIEFWPSQKIDLELGVGMKGGPLWQLRN